MVWVWSRSHFFQDYYSKTLPVFIVLHSIWDSILDRILSTPHRESGAVQSSSVACPAADPHRQSPTGPGQTLHPASGLWPGETQWTVNSEQCVCKIWHLPQMTWNHHHALLGHGFTSGGQELGSVFTAAVCKQAINYKRYVESLSLVLKIKNLLLTGWKVRCTVVCTRWGLRAILVECCQSSPKAITGTNHFQYHTLYWKPCTEALDEVWEPDYILVWFSV